MRRKAKPKLLKLPFNRKLILNQWLIEYCGFRPLRKQAAPEELINSLKSMYEILKFCSEGIGTDNLHDFYKKLDGDLSEEHARIKKEDLLTYEHNIVCHTQTINQGRTKEIVWKYFQWLSLLFTEIYLDKYFSDREALLVNLNDFVRRYNDLWQRHGYEANIDNYEDKDLNKLCLQNATGSGKTLIMHVNFLQFSHYAQLHKMEDQYNRTILLTPNERLSEQHSRELLSSRIRRLRLSKERNDYTAETNRGLDHIEYTEITKLSDEKIGPKLINIKSLGDKNLLLVDEGHRGMNSTEEKGWFKNRQKLVEKGFVFEYSATFKEAVSAAKNEEIEKAYSKNILFDYSYGYFYADGYGKDYKVFNLPQSYADLKFNYLVGCLLSFYQQIKIYKDKQEELLAYNFEKPLWVFVGNRVNKGSKKDKTDKETISDVAMIIEFIAKILQDGKASISAIDSLIRKTGEESGLLDDNGNDIFAGNFSYIKDLQLKNNWEAKDFYKDILSQLFLTDRPGLLKLRRVKGDDSEIILSVGDSGDRDNSHFGLINVGDALGLLNHISDAQKQNSKTPLNNVILGETDFLDPQFKTAHYSFSSINILLGSKKFVEGWDCWRVSTLGLMHVGKREGSQIIQLFGRGVRLKGYDFKLQRSDFADLDSHPDHINYLETLNIFGIQADFMEKFRSFLEEEELPNQKEIFSIPIKINYDFNTKVPIKILSPRHKKKDGSEYDFNRDGRSIRFGCLPEQLIEKQTILVDWYPRIESMASTENIAANSSDSYTDANKNQTYFSDTHLGFLDYDEIFFDLDRIKNQRRWYNLNISYDEISQLLKDKNWYHIFAPNHTMELSNISNIPIWQAMAKELLRKYCEAIYNYHKMEFSQTRLELRNLTCQDKNLPAEDKYKITIDKKEKELIKDINLLIQQLKKKDKKMPIQHGYLQALKFGAYLYEPLIHYSNTKGIKMNPPPLNRSEFDFAHHFQEYISSLEIPEGEEYYLLRNMGRGRGVGFFEAGNFYPDFILWKITKDKQFITFVEPHGMIHEGLNSPKVQFRKTIKKIQKRLPQENIELNSFIVTPTRYSDLKKIHPEEKENIIAMNVLFMNDRDQSNYIRDMMLSIDSEANIPQEI